MADWTTPIEVAGSRRRALTRAPLLVVLVCGLLLALGARADARGATVTVIPRDATTLLPVPAFSFLVSEDNTLDAPSAGPMASHSPVVATGDEASATVDLPDGKYLITVRADGYKLWGAHVRLPDQAGDVIVDLIPGPLPLGFIQVTAFHDNAPVNSEQDIPREEGLAGFQVVIDDPVGEVTVDYFGNPLCGGQCVTDRNGEAVIPNLPPGKYEVQVIPPDGTDWIQTSTIEGTHVIDVWLEEGGDGTKAGEAGLPATLFGFVQPMDFAAPGTGTITGTARTLVEFIPPLDPVVMSEPVQDLLVALNDVGGNDTQIYTARGNPDGAFAITGVPAGLYELVLWDEKLDYIIRFVTVQVGAGETVDLGDVWVPRWFGWLSGTVFRDDNGDGVQDPGEGGLAGVAVGTRFRDGSIQYGTVTDGTGYYELPEVFPLGRFTIEEIDFARFAATGAVVHDFHDPNVVTTHDPGVLTLNALTWFGMRSIVDWGKRPYDAGENGGISGIVYYATTRNELNPRYAAAEDYEPGIPGVTVNLYAADGVTLLNEVETDAWEHPSDCDYRDSTGVPLDDPLGLGPNCVEVVNIANEVKDGLFDGGYAFTTDSDGDPLPPGDYVVEVVPPAGYEIVKEEDQNTDQGDDFVPAIPPAPCVGDLHLVSDPRNPSDGQQTPLCDKRLVTLTDGQNAAADFFLFTQVPIPGRLAGMVLDDLNVETDPNRLFYGEKRGIANVPVGIRDFTGRLITTAASDAEGWLDVLLPSTYTANCPIPSGVCPGMYVVVVNDPGDQASPNANYNPNYATRTFAFDIWPGKMTAADLAIFPRSNARAACNLPAGTPRLHSVSQPYVTATSRAFSIVGANFGASPGTVRVGSQAVTITGWTDTQIDVSVPIGFPVGPQQLEVRTAGGKTTPTGLTFHVIGGTYVPAVRTVAPGGSIQAVIDAAPQRSLVVVPPGRYPENVILNKNLKLQGSGPGAPGTGDGGTIIDGSFFPEHADAWTNRINQIPFAGNRNFPPGSAITVVGGSSTHRATFPTSIDGFLVTGTNGEGGAGIHVNAYGRSVQVANNVIEGNGGVTGGGITLGQPYVGDNQNRNVRIHHNRILHNGGLILAGGVGIYTGANGYELDHNELCGNYSAEYGGGLSHFGLSPNSRIHHNTIAFNEAFDEGGGVLVGGELARVVGGLSRGSGIVDIRANLVEGNLSNDDGGGIRLLQPLTYRISIVNNMIVNNTATDLGGGIALDDASNVQIINNTVAKNASTATAVDSDGLAHGAGLVSEGHSDAFQARLPAGAADFSKPVLFNNIFWDNQAYTWDGTQLVLDGVIDFEVFGTLVPRTFTPTYTLMTVAYGPAHASNIVGQAPDFLQEYDTQLSAVPFALEPNFVTIIVVTPAVPGTAGDYHVATGSPAVDAGTAGTTVSAPSDDFDGDPRPRGVRHDIGADEAA